MAYRMGGELDGFEFSFCICCLKCSVLILMLCLCFFKKHTNAKLRAEQSVEIRGSYKLFVFLVPKFWGLGGFLAFCHHSPKSFHVRLMSAPCPQPGFL